MTVVYGYVHLPVLQQKGDDINAVLVRGECFHAVYIYMGEIIFCPRPGAVDRVIEHFFPWRLFRKSCLPLRVKR